MDRLKPTSKKKSNNKAEMKWALLAQYYFNPESQSFNNAEASAIRAGFSVHYAKSITTRSGWDKVGQGLADALNRIGINHDFLAGKIKELLEAKRIIRNVSKDIQIEELDSRAMNYGLTHALAVRGDRVADKVEVGASTEILEALARLKAVITVRPSENQR